MDSAVAAELTAIADGIERYHQRVGGLVATLGTGPHRDAMGDVLATLHEVERALKSADRGLLRASKLARQT